MQSLPQLLYWKWSDEILELTVLERKLDDICDRSGFNTIVVSFHWMEADFFDARVQGAIRRACEILARRGRRLLLDLDIRTEGGPFAAQYPGTMSGFVAFLEISLDERGRGVGCIAAETVHRFGRKRTACADTLAAAWALNPRGDDFDPSSLARITDACRGRVTPEGGTEYAVDAGANHAGKVALLFPRFTHVVPDLFAPAMYDYFRDMFEAVRDLPLLGAAVDEWGQSCIFHFDEGGMYFRELAYSAHMDVAYAVRYGRPLADDLLHLRYGPRETRVRVANQYIENFRDGMARNEAWFYNTTKEYFGPDAFVGTHPTWLGGRDALYLEVMQNGLDWWQVRRDFAQTDEEVIFPIRFALAHKAGGRVWYNMFYSAGTEDPATYFPETWGNVRWGGRTHQLGYECPHEPGVARFAERGVLESIWSMEQRIARLDAVQQASADCRVLVLFGMEACTNWEFSVHKSRRFDNASHPRLTAALRFAAGLFESHLCDLVPTSEAVDGSLGWEEGRPRYGNQRYDVVILVEPECMRPEAYGFLEGAPAGFPVYVFGEAEMLADATEARARFAALARNATWHERTPPPVAQVASRLAAEGIAANRFACGCVLQDGSLLFAAEGTRPTGNPLRVEVEHRGHRIEFEGEDFFFIALGRDGTLERWACGAARVLRLDGRDLEPFESEGRKPPRGS